MLSGFADLSLLQLALIAVSAACTSLIGGVAGYGTGALMPLVLVPIVGPEPVVPIIALSALFTNGGRSVAFRPLIDFRRAAIVIACAIPSCIAGAFGYTLLTGKGALIVIGGMMMASVPLRTIARKRGFALSDRGLGIASSFWGFIVGGTTGAGVILLSMLLAAGLAGRAVVATDAVVSMVIGVVKLSVFGVAGVVTAQVVAVAVLIGCITFPGAFVARKIVERLPLHVHTAILDAVVMIGGAVMVAGALLR